MKILIIGAGVLGTNLAHKLKKEHDITFLVRPEAYTTFAKNGVVIRHKPFGFRTTDHFCFTTSIDDKKDYDLVIASVRYSQLESVTELIKTSNIPNVLFVGNNMTAEQICLPNKNVLFGFFHAGGYRHDGYIDSICLNKITVGQLNGNGEQDSLIQSIFNGTGISLDIQNAMGDWLKAHAVAVLPTVFASYQTNGDLKKLSKDKEYSKELVKAIQEAYDVLRSLDHQIKPDGEYEEVSQKPDKCAFLYRFMFSCFIGKVCISDHAMHAKEEMTFMLTAFDELCSRSNIKTPTFNKLRMQSGLMDKNI